MKKIIRGAAYLAKCLNPFAEHIIVNSPLFKASFYAHKYDVIGRAIYKKQDYDNHICRHLLDFGPGVYIDVGANIGYYTVLFSQLAGDGKVYAFEPAPSNFELLQKNIILNSCINVTLFQVAVGKEEATMNLGLYKSSNSGRHSLLEDYGMGTVPVSVKRLDDVIENQPVKLLKVDVEGYELEVLRGATATLRNVQTLLIEYTSNATDDNSEFIDILQNNFAKCYCFNDGGYNIKIKDLASLKGQFELMLTK